MLRRRPTGVLHLVLLLGFIKLGCASVATAPECLLPPEPLVRIGDCCTLPDVYLNNIVDTCVRQVLTFEMKAILTNSQTGPKANTPRCLFECLRETNVALFGSRFVQKTWQPVIQDVTQECLRIGEHLSSKNETAEAAGAPCDYMGVFFISCLQTKLFQRCPTAAQPPAATRNAAKAHACQAIRHRAVECPVLGAVVERFGEHKRLDVEVGLRLDVRAKSARLPHSVARN